MNHISTNLEAPLRDLDMYVGGEWVESEAGGRMPVINPATGQAIGSVPEGTREDARRAVAAAAEAEETLRWMTPAERSAMCKRVVEALERHRDEMARVVTLDQGKPYHKEGKWEAGACQHFFREA